MRWRVPFGELRIGPTGRKKVATALNRNWVSEGPNVAEFERRFAEKFGYKHAIAVSSGTTADLCACMALYERGAKRGDEIIVPALCFAACVNSVLAAGFKPRFVDVEMDTLNLNVLDLEDAITDRTVAIMAVHTMGKPVAMNPVMRTAKSHGLAVIEDCCEAHGAVYRNRIVGSIGDMGTFSFYAAHLVVAGEGGMVVTSDDRIADTIRSVKSHGRPPNSIYFDFQRFGLNAKMNDLTAAIGLDTLARFDTAFQRRQANMRMLRELLSDLPYQFYKEEAYELISPHAFPLVLREDNRVRRDNLYKHLEKNGIQCKTLFGSLPTQHPAFDFLGHKLGDFPIAEYIGRNGLHFGIHQYLRRQDIEYISEIIHKFKQSPTSAKV